MTTDVPTTTILVELELLARRAAELAADAGQLEDQLGALMARIIQASGDDAPGDVLEHVHRLADQKEATTVAAVLSLNGDAED